MVGFSPNFVRTLPCILSMNEPLYMSLESGDIVEYTQRSPRGQGRRFESHVRKATIGGLQSGNGG